MPLSHFMKSSQLLGQNSPYEDFNLGTQLPVEIPHSQLSLGNASSTILRLMTVVRIDVGLLEYFVYSLVSVCYLFNYMITLGEIFHDQPFITPQRADALKAFFHMDDIPFSVDDILG